MKKKLLFYVTMLATSLVMSTMAYAEDNVVSQSQDNIIVTKTANWTKLDDKSADETGNPYIKIDFEIDTTNMDTKLTENVTSGGDVDVVLVIDNSMSYQDKFPKAKEAVEDFVDDVMSLRTNNVRVGIVKFGLQATTVSQLSNNMTDVKKAVESIELQGTEISGTNMHHGVCNAEEMLKSSSANTKVIIILSDGRPNRTKEIIEEHNRDRARKAVKDELKKAKEDISNLEVVTIGYYQKDDDASREFMKEIATSDSKGQKMTFDTGDIADNIKEIFEKISQSVTSYVVGKGLIDTIPAECSIVESSFTTNDDNLLRSISGDKHEVKFGWRENKIERKKYQVSFVMVLDKAVMNSNQLSGKEKIHTNGQTININTDTVGSSMFVYDNYGIIKLASPKLTYKEVCDTTEEKSQINEITEDLIDETPPTGDNFNLIIVVVMAVCGVVLLALRRKFI
ncbi:MAG: VWA domain-containing protein [Lachnospiraceae bacterium]|nr:VWA domain-containing protein [Lachnospiraceae bacterium]